MSAVVVVLAYTKEYIQIIRFDLVVALQRMITNTHAQRSDCGVHTFYCKLVSKFQLGVLIRNAHPVDKVSAIYLHYNTLE